MFGFLLVYYTPAKQQLLRYIQIKNAWIHPNRLCRPPDFLAVKISFYASTHYFPSHKKRINKIAERINRELQRLVVIFFSSQFIIIDKVKVQNIRTLSNFRC